MKKRTSAIITLTSALLLTFSLAGCGSAGSTASVDGSSAAAKADTIQTSASSSNAGEGGDELIVGVSSIVDKPFDPAVGGTENIDQYNEIFDALITGDGKGKYSPGLADSWTLADDKKSFTLNLRKGVKFQDGSDFTSEDVKFTLEYYMGDTSNQSDKQVLNEYIESIDTPDDYTVVLHFKKPCTGFEYWLSTSGTGAGFILPSDYFQKVGQSKFGQAPIGTGPYKLEEYQAGQKIVYTANEDYWGDVPAFKKLVLKGYSEESTRITDLQAGNLDFAPVSETSAALFDNKNGFRVERVPDVYNESLFIYGAVGQDNGKAAQNADVRKALSYAINRKEIVDSIYSGNAEAANVSSLFPFTEGYENDTYKAEYDTAKAKQLLKSAGYPDKFQDPDVKLFVSSSASSTINELAQAILSYWKAVGIEAEIVPIDSSELSSNIVKHPVAEKYAGGVGFFGPPKKVSAFDALQFWASDINFGLVQGDKTLDTNIHNLLSLDGTELSDDVTNILKSIRDYSVDVPLVYMGETYVVSSKVTSFDSNAGTHPGNWYATFR